MIFHIEPSICVANVLDPRRLAADGDLAHARRGPKRGRSPSRRRSTRSWAARDSLAARRVDVDRARRRARPPRAAPPRRPRGRPRRARQKRRARRRWQLSRDRPRRSARRPRSGSSRRRCASSASSVPTGTSWSSGNCLSAAVPVFMSSTGIGEDEQDAGARDHRDDRPRASPRPSSAARSLVGPGLRRAAAPAPVERPAQRAHTPAGRTRRPRRDGRGGGSERAAGSSPRGSRPRPPSSRRAPSSAAPGCRPSRGRRAR